MIEISGVCSPNNIKPGKICFISKEKYINKETEKAAVILCSPELLHIISNENILYSDNPQLAFIKILDLFKVKTSKPDYVNDQIIFLGKNTKIGSNFVAGANVVLEDSVVIGNNVNLGHNVVVHNNVIIGNNVTIGSGTVIGSEGFGNFYDEKLGWVHIPHIGSVSILDNVSIGSNCSIDRGTIDNTVINSGVIIDNQVHIAHNVQIGENTAIAANTGIAGSCIIGKRNMIGGMVGIVNHINTADDVIISATSTVNKDLKEPGVYTGIMPISKHTIWKRIALWITKLDKIVIFINFKKK